jgi:hypothetical protein
MALTNVLACDEKVSMGKESCDEKFKFEICPFLEIFMSLIHSTISLIFPHNVLAHAHPSVKIEWIWVSCWEI